MFNRLTGLEIDLGTERPILHGSYAGHGGAWMLHFNLRWIHAAYPRLSIPISASGGAMTADDAIKFILVGASSVQLCTVVYLSGYSVVNEFAAGLEKFMEEKGYASLAEFKGKVQRTFVSMERVDRSGKYIARLSPEICNLCGICKPVCIYSALDYYDDRVEINADRCDGCGLCATVCPVGAIAVERVV